MTVTVTVPPLLEGVLHPLGTAEDDHAVPEAEKVDHPGEVLFMAVFGGEAVVGGDESSVAGTFGRCWLPILSSHQAKFGLLGPKCCYIVLKYLNLTNSLTCPHPMIIPIAIAITIAIAINLEAALRLCMFKS